MNNAAIVATSRIQLSIDLDRSRLRFKRLTRAITQAVFLNTSTVSGPPRAPGSCGC
jgi:hypothetical protein